MPTPGPLQPTPAQSTGGSSVLRISSDSSTATKAQDIAAQAKSYQQAARAKLRDGDPNGAVDDCRKAIALLPGHEGAFADLLTALTQSGRVTEGIKIAHEAIKAVPANATFHAQLANLLLKRGNLSYATEMFQAALALDAKHPGALAGLASVYFRQGRTEPGLVLLRKAASLWPLNAGLRVRLGQALEDHHQLADSAAAYREALAIDGSSQPALAGLRRVRDPAQILDLVRCVVEQPQDAQSLRALREQLDVSERHLQALIGFTKTPRACDIAAITHSPLERLMLEALLRASQRKEYRRLRGTPAPLIRRQLAGPETDPLGEPGSHENWIPAQWFSFHTLRDTAAAQRAAVVVTMRDEGIYIVEWVAHYRSLGFDTIFVYSNDNADGSEGLLRALAEYGLITYIENSMDPAASYHPQKKAYGHALHLLPELWEHDWALFVDSDELLVLDTAYQNDIKRLIGDAEAHYEQRVPSAICFNWHWCVSGSRYAYEPELLLKRFPHALPKRGMKSLVRLKDTLSMHSVHFPDFSHDGFLVRSDFSKFDKALRWKKLPPVLKNAYINHYWNKSFEEFSVKKARGDAAGNRDHLWRRSFELFFTKNEAETDENYAPPPDGLTQAVEQEVGRLMSLPGIAAWHAEMQSQFTRLLTRFADGPGLAGIYQTTREATRGQYAAGFGPDSRETAADMAQ